jgi:hypothetical protein
VDAKSDVTIRSPIGQPQFCVTRQALAVLADVRLVVEGAVVVALVADAENVDSVAMSLVPREFLVTRVTLAVLGDVELIGFGDLRAVGAENDVVGSS